MDSPITKGPNCHGYGSNVCSTTGRKYVPSCPTRTECPHFQKMIDGYFCFKRKLLEAMQESDPLEILELGIFDEFEVGLNFHQHSSGEVVLVQSKKASKQKQGECLKVTDFETVLQTYQMSKQLAITQLQRRSRSCSPKIKQKQMSLNKMQMRNVEFVLWTNAIRQIKPDQSPQSVLQEIKVEQLRQQMERQKQSLLDQCLENQHLRQRLADIESIHQTKKEPAAVSNEDDHRLEYLLKQKQLQKKLQEAKDEIEHLRTLLQRNMEYHSTPQIFWQGIEESANNSLSILREKIQNQARVKRALQLVWGHELESECNQSHQQ